MKAMVLERYGAPDALRLRDVERPSPKPGEVLVRVHAASVNDWDWGILQGDSLLTRLMYGLTAPKIRILGCDIAGRVEALGADASRFQPGDAVYGDLCGCGFGAFADYVCVPETAVRHKPPTLTFEQAAALPQAGMLAWQGLFDAGHLQPGQSLLLNGAGGGVGTLALQIAKRLGAEVSVVDRADKLEPLRALGADHAFDYRQTDFTRQGRRYDLILDVKTNRPPWAYARALNPGGTYVTVGGDLPRLLQMLTVGPLLSRTMGKRFRLVALKPNKDLADLEQRLEAGPFTPVLDRAYPLAELGAAFNRFGASDHVGKILILT